jgi:predicted TPR repeat methyltransferase
VNDRRERRAGFEALYARESDPWDFETSDYESEKREATIAALEGRRFEACFEPGCSTGVLTKALCDRCECLTAMDVAATPLERARRRLVSCTGVTIRRGDMVEDWPRGSFDLIVLSEVLYFLSPEEVAAVARLTHNSLRPGGWCLLVNWTGKNDLPVSGDECVDIFRRAGNWTCGYARQGAQYRIDRFAPDCTSK